MRCANGIEWARAAFHAYSVKQVFRCAPQAESRLADSANRRHSGGGYFVINTFLQR
jgi:hypothetical protein